jgi:hypothetical protein
MDSRIVIEVSAKERIKRVGVGEVIEGVVGKASEVIESKTVELNKGRSKDKISTA